MNSFEELDRQLVRFGWSYDSHGERFTNGLRRVAYQKILALVPGMTLGELASYVNHKHSRSGTK